MVLFVIVEGGTPNCGSEAGNGGAKEVLSIRSIPKYYYWSYLRGIADLSRRVDQQDCRIMPDQLWQAEKVDEPIAVGP